MVERHQFDADSDPDPTFHLMQIQIRFLPQVLHMLENKKTFFFTFLHRSSSLHCFVFLVSGIGVIIFNFFRQYIEIFRKKYIILKCIRIRIGRPWIRLRNRQHDAESDRIRIRIHNTAQDPCDFGIGSQSP
jgi:hypothetical protein